jgi:hypothetical protein
MKGGGGFANITREETGSMDLFIQKVDYAANDAGLQQHEVNLLVGLLCAGVLALTALIIYWKRRAGSLQKTTIDQIHHQQQVKLNKKAAWPNFAYLVQLGFAREEVAQALRATSHVLPDAIEWLRVNTAHGAEVLDDLPEGEGLPDSFVDECPSYKSMKKRGKGKGKGRRNEGREFSQKQPIDKNGLEEAMEGLPSEEDFDYFREAIRKRPAGGVIAGDISQL